MPRYTVQHRYSSNHNGRVFGPWEAGDGVELTELDAEWVNRDSVDVLRPVDPDPDPDAAAAAAAGDKPTETGTADESAKTPASSPAKTPAAKTTRQRRSRR